MRIRKVLYCFSKTVNVFVSQVVSRYGVPLEIHTDQSHNLDSKFVTSLAQVLGIRKTRTTPLHLASNGQVKKQHQTILYHLTKYVSENQLDWDQWISLFLLAYRSSNHATTGATSPEMLMGNDLRLLHLLRGSVPGEDFSSPYEYVKQLRHHLDRICEFDRK